MINVECVVGRLCEIRADSAVAVADMTLFRARLATVFQSVPSRVVICSDLRDCASLPVAVVQALIGIARVDNPKIERHAMLVTRGQPVAAQLELVIAEAANANRRTFVSTAEAVAWLEPTLRPEELARLRLFVAA